MEIEFILIVILSISGIIFFWGLEKSIKSTSMTPKILYLLLSTLCSIIMIEAIFRLLNTRMYSNNYSSVGTFSSNISFYFFRVFQILLIVLGILMSLAIFINKNKSKQT